MFIGKSFFFIGEYNITQLCNSLSQGLCSKRSRVGYYGTMIKPLLPGGSEREQIQNEKGNPGCVNIYLSKINISFFTLTRAIIHIFYLHHLCVDSPSEQVARTLCGCLAVF